MGVYTVDIHVAADVHHTVTLGHGSVVHVGAVIQEGTTLGPDCVVGNGVSIGRRCQIGRGCVFQTGAAICHDAQIGDYVSIGPHAVLINTRRPNLRDRAQEVSAPPMLEDDVVLGSHAQILPGVRVGAGAFVHAASVVYLDVPPGQAVRGNPARPILFPASILAKDPGPCASV